MYTHAPNKHERGYRVIPSVWCVSVHQMYSTSNEQRPFNKQQYNPHLRHNLLAEVRRPSSSRAAGPIILICFSRHHLGRTAPHHRIPAITAVLASGH